MTKRDPVDKRRRRDDRDDADASDDNEVDASDDDELDASSADEDVTDESSADGDDDVSDDDDDGDEPSKASMDAMDIEDEPSLDPVEDEGVPLGIPGGAAWALPLLKFERRWVWLETRMMFASLLGLTAILCFWIGLRGMKEPLEAQVPAGTVWRALVGAAALGTVTWIATKGRVELMHRNIATVVAVIIGIAVAGQWRGVGINYFEQVLDWLQEGSSITLFGGLKGISTRLTMLVALLGGSLAASTGTHINIDIVVRLIPKSLRRPLAVVTATATAAVCLSVSYGFLDHVAVTAFRADVDAPMTDKVGVVTHEMGEQFFVWRKQTGLDLGALPHVLSGKKWNSDDRMKGKEWNAFLENEGFVERYGAEKVKDIKAPDTDLEEPWRPFVVVPDGETRGIMVHFMDLLWPVGFFMIFLKFLLRAVLIVAGQVHVHVEGEGSDDDELPAGAAKEAA
jgi:Tripartite ATP-independent periplasmic transporters, DctQ component